MLHLLDPTRNAGYLGAVATLLAVGACLPGRTAAQPSPEEILRNVDENMAVESAHALARMTISYRNGDVRELEFESWGEGRDLSFLEFTAPAREAGSRFLRRDENMWIFLPSAGKSVRIQGHMLRQGLMGSDFSYGDASENPSMIEDYDAAIERSDTLDGRPVLVLYLTAKRRDVTYTYRRIWIDSERWIPLKEERFARSGKLLKTAILGDVRRIDGRWYPFRIDLDDALQAETRSSMQFLDLELGVDVPDDVFTLRHLETGV
jgi:outer membrane lipoprotein-sorting protein